MEGNRCSFLIYLSLFPTLPQKINRKVEERFPITPPSTQRNTTEEIEIAQKRTREAA